MADLKISQLTAISVLTPATDVLPVVDVGGVTKKITTNQILGSGGTATLASATITGDLTAARLIVTGGTIPTNGLWLPTTNTLEFAANSLAQYRIAPLGVFSWFDGAGGTRMTLNSTGLGIGYVPSGSADKLGSAATLGVVATGATADLNFRNSSLTSIQRIRYTDGTGVLTIGSATGTSYPVELGGNTTTRAVTIDASGNLLVNATAITSNERLRVNSTSAGQWAVAMTSVNRGWINRQSDATGGIAAFFEVGSSNTNVGSITTTASATSYVTVSDYRLKENVQPLVGGLARISALKPSIYKWKVDGSDGEGFLAHELTEVVPLAVTGDKDAVNADGKPAYQGVDLSKFVPILVAAIQELTARVQTLEAR
jgi:Chaperone of endosialidase